MNPNASTDPDLLPETCHEEGHVYGCPGAAGGDHEIDPLYLFPEDWTVNAEGFLVAPLDWKGELGG